MTGPVILDVCGIAFLLTIEEAHALSKQLDSAIYRAIGERELAKINAIRAEASLSDTDSGIVP